ncbi:MAG: hypothetical protein ACI9Y1_000149 [Lentisphaeria bacterium]|jgi:hypothetical protein
MMGQREGITTQELQFSLLGLANHSGEAPKAVPSTSKKLLSHMLRIRKTLVHARAITMVGRELPNIALRGAL